VIVGLLLGDEIGGVPGIFLAVPLMAVLKIIVAHAWAAHQASVKVRLGNRGAVQPPAAVTQTETQVIE